jgi:hypothetical protein
MTGCVFPTLTREDVAALGDIERATARVQSAVTSAILTAGAYRTWHTASDRCRPRMLTHDKGRHVPNHARHVPPGLRRKLLDYHEHHCPDVLSAQSLMLFRCHFWLAIRGNRRMTFGIRPRRVTIDGLAIVRGKR